MIVIYKKAEAVFAYFGLVAVVFQIFAALYIFTSDASLFQEEYTFSNVATIDSLRIGFVLLLNLSAISFLIFLTKSFSKKYSINNIAVWVSMLSFVALVSLPYDLGNSSNVLQHKILGVLMYTAFLWGVFSIAKNNKHLALRKYSYFCFIANLILFPQFLIISPQSYAFLVWEICVVIVNQAWIVFISMILLKDKALALRESNTSTPVARHKIKNPR